MIKLIHRYKQSITIVFLFIAFCFVVTSVGFDAIQSNLSPTSDAITVNKQGYSAAELDRTQRSIESRYRQMFGEKFYEIAESLNLNLRQQALDTLVDKVVLQQEADKIGFAATNDSVREYIPNKVFRGPNGESLYSPEEYRRLLQRVGMSAPVFEQEIKDEITRSALISLFKDVAVVTNKDVEARFLQQKTRYGVVAATITDSAATSSVPAPSEADLKAYYNLHATEFETPAQVSYSYYALAPKDFEKEVQVTAQDVEFYYSENQSKYSIPEQVRVRRIKLLYPKESDPVKMAAVREKANAARSEALSGQSFELLVTKYSDDLPSKLAGGDIGWVGHGDQPEAIDQAIWKTAPGAIADLVETDYGFEVLKVEEKRAARPRPLDDVRASIEQEIRAQEAPAYASNKAREIVSQVKKDNKSLDEVVRSAGGSLKATNGFLTQGTDPEPSLKGLTQNIFTTPSSERLKPALIEIGENSIVVQVTEFREPTTPLYEEIKAKLAAGYIAQEASKLARSNAEELLKAALNNPASFSPEATAKSAKIVGPFSLSREEPTSDKFPALTAEMRKAILSTESPDKVLGRVFSSPTEHTILKVVEIKAPNLSDPSFKDKASEYRSQAAQELTQKSMGAMLAMLKERSTIEINPNVVTNQ